MPQEVKERGSRRLSQKRAQMDADFLLEGKLGGWHCKCRRIRSRRWCAMRFCSNDLHQLPWHSIPQLWAEVFCSNDFGMLSQVRLLRLCAKRMQRHNGRNCRETLYLCGIESHNNCQRSFEQNRLPYNLQDRMLQQLPKIIRAKPVRVQSAGSNPWAPSRICAINNQANQNLRSSAPCSA